MLLGSVLRFWLKGWIDELYIQPRFFFHYYGFDWVQPVGQYTYLLFAICGLAAFLFAIGLWYRVASVVLFLSFTYIELMDKTNYLNHYYFTSLVLLLMTLLPAHCNFSVDAWRKPQLLKRQLPLFTVGSIRLMLGIVYCYAGLAKLNSDWLFDAMPLRIWLPARNDMPLIGPLLSEVWVAYFFSWFGAVYDLTIPFFLLNRRTRPYAYFAVVAFHVMTSVLFPIGMFPYIMIVSSLVFLDSATMDRWLQQCSARMPRWTIAKDQSVWTFAPAQQKILTTALILFFGFQALFPFRYLCTSDELFWTEEGYRFSWRVMLMEKTGYAQFIVKDKATGETVVANNEQFLTRNQEKMMATQPDFMLQYAQLLRQVYLQQGMKDPAVYAQVYVSLNGRRSRLLIDPETDLARVQDAFGHKQWILPFGEQIYGL